MEKLSASCVSSFSRSSMSQYNGSLILKEEARLQAELQAAPFLFSEDELSKIDKTKPKCHCTGERLFRDDPDRYKALVKLIAEPGVSVRTICRDLNVSDHTVQSVAAREMIPIATLKKQVLFNITHGIRLASERVIELMPEASARDALLGVGILGDKMQLLSGDVTARLDIDVTRRLDCAAELNRLLEEAHEMVKRANAHVVGDETDLDGEKSEQKALMNGDHRQHWDGIVEVDATSAPEEEQE
jgi:hypothetical protein